MLFLQFLAAQRTQAFQYIVGRKSLESLWQVYRRDRLPFHAESAVTFGTVEVGVQFLDRAAAFLAAYGIFQRAGTVVNAMNQVFGQKHGYGAEYC